MREPVVIPPHELPEHLQADLARMSASVERQNLRRRLPIRLSMETAVHVIGANRMEDGGYHVAKEAGQRFSHLEIRIPNALAEFCAWAWQVARRRPC